jgi:hypothetical protein
MQILTLHIIAVLQRLSIHLLSSTLWVQLLSELLLPRPKASLILNHLSQHNCA